MQPALGRWPSGSLLVGPATQRFSGVPEDRVSFSTLGPTIPRLARARDTEFYDVAYDSLAACALQEPALYCIVRVKEEPASASKVEKPFPDGCRTAIEALG